MIVRPADQDDFMELLGLARQFAQITGEPFDRESYIQHVEWLINDECATVLVCDDDEGDLVGMISGICVPVFWDVSKKTAAELWWFVDPSARGKGVGGLLLRALESWACQLGAWRLSMMSIGDATPGIENLYQTHGYVPKERTFVKELK